MKFNVKIIAIFVAVVLLPLIDFWASTPNPCSSGTTYVYCICNSGWKSFHCSGTGHNGNCGVGGYASCTLDGEETRCDCPAN